MFSWAFNDKKLRQLFLSPWPIDVELWGQILIIVQCSMWCVCVVHALCIELKKQSGPYNFLVISGNLTWIIGEGKGCSDWSRQVTRPEYWPLIGQERKGGVFLTNIALTEYLIWLKAECQNHWKLIIKLLPLLQNIAKKRENYESSSQGQFAWRF